MVKIEMFGEYSLNIGYEKISIEQLKEIINNDDFLVQSISVSENSYGEYLFVELYQKSSAMCVTYYGIGYHDYKGKYIFTFTGFRNHNSEHNGDNFTPIHKIMAEREIGKRNVECIKRNNELVDEQTESQVMYEMLTDALGDEDGVLSEMEDAGLI